MRGLAGSLLMNTGKVAESTEGRNDCVHEAHEAHDLYHRDEAHIENE